MEVNNVGYYGNHAGRTVTDPNDFESMLSELRKSFLEWLKKTNEEWENEKVHLTHEEQKLETDRGKLWTQLMAEKELEIARLKEDRRKTENELATQLRQINTERADMKRKVQEDKQKFEDEKSRHKFKLVLEKEKFRREFNAFQIEKNKMVDLNIATETLVDLNVGGVVFETSRHTLIQQPGSFLEAVLSGRQPVERDRRGRIFLDRDSELFRLLLNFLRNPSTPPIPRDLAESDAVAKEASFFGVKFYPFPLAWAVGGHNGVEHLRAVEVLDIGQQCWRPCEPMETERAHFGSAAIRNNLFAFGGQNLDYKALCDMEIFDCIANRWVGGASLNLPRRHLCSVACENRIFAIGGFDSSNILSSVECYDPRMKSWMEIAPLNVPRSSAMCCEQGGKIYVLGGTKGERLCDGEFYDQRMNKWLPMEKNMIEVRSAGCGASIGNHIYVMGGTNNANIHHSSLEILDLDTSRWHFGRVMSEARMDCACVAISDSILVAGGQSDKVSNTTEFFRPELNEWQPGPPLVNARYSHQLIVSSV